LQTLCEDPYDGDGEARAADIFRDHIDEGVYERLAAESPEKNVESPISFRTALILAALGILLLFCGSECI